MTKLKLGLLADDRRVKLTVERPPSSTAISPHTRSRSLPRSAELQLLPKSSSAHVGKVHGGRQGVFATSGWRRIKRTSWCQLLRKPMQSGFCEKI